MIRPSKLPLRAAACLAVAGLALAVNANAASESEHFLAVDPGGLSPKSATAQSFAARATVTPSAPAYGAFELRSSAVVYILVRGPSLGTLGVTPNGLDAPWVRVFDGNGRDLVSTTLTNGASIPGAGRCDTSSTLDKPVVDYYKQVRNAPTHERDSCIATVSLPAGSYTFSITPSVPTVTSTQASSPSTGEILFEVTLGPTAPVASGNYAKTEQLVGGTWTFTYNIGSSSFTQPYTFSSVVPASTAGEFNAVGKDQSGDLVVGTYAGSSSFWAVLDKSVILDRFFTFTFSDANRVSGCYYQISPPGSSSLGTCYPMTGVRSPVKALEAPANPMQREVEEEAVGRAAEAVYPGTFGAPSDAQDVLRDMKR